MNTDRDRRDPGRRRTGARGRRLRRPSGARPRGRVAYPRKKRRGRDSGRLTAQVLIATLPLGNVSKAEIRQSLAASFGKAKRATNIVRRYRRAPTPLVRNGDGTLRSGKVEDVLRGNFDLFGHGPA